MERCSGAFAWIGTLIQEGPGGLWKYLQEKLSDLWNQVLAGVASWISTEIIEAATEKVLSMLDPTGVMAVVNSFLAIYRAVQSFVQKLRQMLEIVSSVLDGVADIAKGVIAAAAKIVEAALANAVPIAIGFLANQVGLGKVGKRVAEMIGKVRATVTTAIDWLIDKGKGAWNSSSKAGGSKQTDVRKIAGQRIHALVGDEATADDVRKVIPKVLAELRPQGLERLFVRDIPSGELQIFAGASPDEEIAALAAQAVDGLKISVSLRADLKMAPPIGSVADAPVPELAYPYNRAWTEAETTSSIADRPPTAKYQGSDVTLFPPGETATTKGGKRSQPSRSREGVIGGGFSPPRKGLGTGYFAVLEHRQQFLLK